MDNAPNVIATKESHQLPDLGLLLPNGIPVFVETALLDQVLALSGVIPYIPGEVPQAIAEVAPLTAAIRSLTVPTPDSIPTPLPTPDSAPAPDPTPETPAESAASPEEK